MCTYNVISASIKAITGAKVAIKQRKQFAATYCIGAMGPGHAPPECLEEFIRVTRSGGKIVFSTHSTESELALPYHDCRANLSEQGLWKQVYETSAFISMPKGDTKIKHVIYVYEVM